MGFREVADVFDAVHGIPPAQKLILVALADRADELGVSWPSVDELCRRTCQSKSTVLRHLRTLQSSGLVGVRHRRKKLPDGRYVQGTSLYILDLTGIRAGKYSQFKPACQNDTLKNSKKENPSSKPGCQNDTLNASACQNKPFQGVASDTHTKDQPNNHPSPQPPMVREGSATPTGAGPNSSAGEEGYFPVTNSLASGCASAPRVNNSSLTFQESSENFETSNDVIPQVESVNGRKESMQPKSGNSRIRGDVASGIVKYETDWALVAECLPESMHALPPREIHSIASLLRRRLAAGWSPQQIHSILAARALPEHVRTLTGLVKARLRDDVPEIAAPPPQFQVSDRIRVRITRESQALQRARQEFASDQKAGDLLASDGFEPWLTRRYPELVKIL